MKAVLLVKEKTTEADGSIVEAVVWQVARDDRHPQGVRYRLAYIPKGHGRPMVLYDNHHPKGHHKHIEGRQCPYSFAGLGSLRADFENEITKWKRARGIAP